MSIDLRYLKDERYLIRIAAIMGGLIGAIAFLFTSSPSKTPKQIQPQEVYAFIVEQVKPTGIDPQFIYALAWAESSLNERAKSSVARGIMQLTRSAWKEVTDESYSQAWDWQTNVRVGIEYIVFCRDFLKQHDAFSYQLLAASYRYGPYYVKKKGFNLSKIKKPKNKIYKLIFAGNIRPILPPVAD